MTFAISLTSAARAMGILPRNSARVAGFSISVVTNGEWVVPGSTAFTRMFFFT